MKLSRLLGLALLTLMTHASGVMAQVEYSDDTFDVDGDWTVFGPFNTRQDSDNSFFGAEQQTENSNPYMAVSLTRATVTSGETATWGAVINNTMMWDPSDPTQGGIGSISIEYDLDGGGAWSMTVQQGEFVWIALARRIVRNTTDPVLISIQGLVATDFVPIPGSEFVFDNQPMHPDFSPGAAPLFFGIGVGFSCPTTSNCTVIAPRTMKIDNLRIEVCALFVINAGLNDAWFNAATAGQGFFFTVFPDIGAMFLAWFTYDTERPPENVMALLGEAGHRWITAFGFFAGAEVVLNAELTSGGVFNSADPPAMQQQGYGTLTLSFCSCSKATLTYDFPSLGLMGVIELTRIANDNVAACEALNLASLQMN